MMECILCGKEREPEMEAYCVTCVESAISDAETQGEAVSVSEQNSGSLAEDK